MKKILIVLTVLAVAGCGSQKSKTTASSSALVGADKDEHGCIGSAGYTWSEVRKDCIRLWEQGMAFKPEKDPNAGSATYVVFSADSTQVEVFWPERKVVLPRANAKMPTWRNEKMDILMNTPNKGWTLMSSADGASYLRSK